MKQLTSQWKKKYMKTIINCIKRLPRLISKGKKPKLSVAQIDELIEVNKDAFTRMGDEADYDGMGDWGRFPPIKKNESKK